MGSDMYMAEQSFRPGPNKAEWDGDDLVITRDLFMRGYTEFWRGPVTKDNESLILKLVRKIPEKPVPLPSLGDKILQVIAEETVLNSKDADRLCRSILAVMDEPAPEREDGRVLPKPLFTKTQDKKKFIKYEDCPYRKGGHQGSVCFQEGDMCPKCGWTL